LLRPKGRESKRLQAAGQWSISALGGVGLDFAACALGLLPTAISPLAPPDAPRELPSDSSFPPCFKLLRASAVNPDFPICARLRKSAAKGFFSRSPRFRPSAGFQFSIFGNSGDFGNSRA